MGTLAHPPCTPLLNHFWFKANYLNVLKLTVIDSVFVI